MKIEDRRLNPIAKILFSTYFKSRNASQGCYERRREILISKDEVKMHYY